MRELPVEAANLASKRDYSACRTPFDAGFAGPNNHVEGAGGEVYNRDIETGFEWSQNTGLWQELSVGVNRHGC